MGTFYKICVEKIVRRMVNFVVRPLARQQRIQHREEETTRFGSVMQIYNPLSQQQ